MDFATNDDAKNAVKYMDGGIIEFLFLRNGGGGGGGGGLGGMTCVTCHSNMPY